MKQLIRQAVRRLGFELVRLDGVHRHSSMGTCLSWLARQDLRVQTILDVGASDGRWSRQCLDVWPDADVVLYEPHPAHVPGIRQFMVDRPGRVEHVASAVGGSNGTAMFDARDAFGGGLVEDGQPGDGTIQVPVVALDASVHDLRVAPPYLVKLDTHGVERGILDGAASVLQQSTVLVIEAYNHRLTSDGMYFWELCSLLHDKGFRPVDLVDVMHRELDGSLWQMDLVFLPATWPGFASRTYQ